MTIILVFLLKSYSTEDIQIAPSDNLPLPVSSSKKPPELAVNAVVSKVAITVEGVEVRKQLEIQLQPARNSRPPILSGLELTVEPVSSGSR